VSSGGFVYEPDVLWSRVCEDSLDKAGYILTFEGVTTTGNVKKVDAAGEQPIGINYKSTEDPLKPGTYLANQEVAIVSTGIVYVQCEDVSISPGTILVASANAKATTPTAAAVTLSFTSKLGIALESKTSGDGKTTILVMLSLG